jgi:hypothetical protein
MRSPPNYLTLMSFWHLEQMMLIKTTDWWARWRRRLA